MKKKIFDVLLKDKKTKEAVAYIFFGIVNTIISFVLFKICFFMGFTAGVSNTITTVVAVLVAYITNKLWVFDSHTVTMVEHIKEFLAFIGGRVFTFVLETALLVFFVDIQHFNEDICKASTLILVVVLNYFISKLFVFKNKASKD